MSDEKGQEGRIKTAQFENYLELDNNPDLTQEMITQAAVAGLTNPEAGINQSDYERLSSSLDSGEARGDGDTPEGVKEFQSMAEGLIGGFEIPLSDTGLVNPEDDWDEKYQQFRRAINSPDNGLSYVTRKQIMADVNTARKALTADPEFILIRKQAIYDVVGFEPDRITSVIASMSTQFKDTVSVGNEFARAVTAERLRLGPGRIDELAAFEKQQAVIFKLKVNSRMLAKVGVKFEFPESGKLDDEYLNNMVDQMMEYLEAKEDSTAVVNDIIGTIDELERINGINLWSRLSPEELALLQ